MPTNNNTENAIYLDDAPYTVDDLTFGEQRKMRDIVRHLAPEGDEAEASEADLIPAVITVIKQRTDPGFTVEQALDFKPGDLEKPAPCSPA